MPGGGVGSSVLPRKCRRIRGPLESRRRSTIGAPGVLIDSPTTPVDKAHHESSSHSPALLALEDGSVFRGESVGAEGTVRGEAVFTTGMSGYQEAVTDPSFAEQIVCFTAPMVGNYGIAAEGPNRVAARGRRDHARGARAGVDGLAARARHRRRQRRRHPDARADAPRARSAARGGCGRRELRRRGGRARTHDRADGGPRARGGRVDNRAVRLQRRGRTRVAVVDYGVKNSVLRRLADAGAAVTVFPHDVDADTLAPYDGVLLSPGPGDPAPLARRPGWWAS